MKVSVHFSALHDVHLIKAALLTYIYVTIILLSERSYPEKVEVTQSSPGASEAAITWSFPEHISLDNLSCFYVSVKKVGKDRVICCKNVAAMNRRDTIDGLEPATKYAVTVVAHYKDGIVKERATEYETLGKLEF